LHQVIPQFAQRFRAESQHPFFLYLLVTLNEVEFYLQLLLTNEDASDISQQHSGFCLLKIDVLRFLVDIDNTDVSDVVVGQQKK
jgi:hypothetical protein